MQIRCGIWIEVGTRIVLRIGTKYENAIYDVIFEAPFICPARVIGITRHTFNVEIMGSSPMRGTK